MEKALPVAYPPEAILNQEQLAEYLQVSVRTIKSWTWLPRLNLPGTTIRYSAGEVLRFLEGKAA